MRGPFPHPSTPYAADDDRRRGGGTTPSSFRLILFAMLCPAVVILLSAVVAGTVVTSRVASFQLPHKGHIAFCVPRVESTSSYLN